ncbi:transcriptional regulator, AraC family [Mycolicibacterium vanbaalenii PYR-1]|uniref:Transcriptional regulator, AraC family n=1 Tax=Mycolicibacterium vanbaalenii (strain DSM 7251 / JCM 13017 / BCRC 16820 / KCTC 9966 / NRRL B-24157 / PYR-1) TaxID=350058 RepID=A1T3N4_MYCVP|nr:AraC family transcriptional regulator [Mycolicibacterium vanbaalenii]ABM11784.1 transcriptional regulator, AraC family [Mycolicibacterium vanbaalenii PYR-1]
MKRDQLSDVFDLIEVAGMVSGGFSVRGDWFCRLEIKDPVKMIGVVCGRVRLATDGYGPIDLEPGDVAILNGCTQVVLKGGPGAAPATKLDVEQSGDAFVRVDGAECGEADVIIGGHVDVNPTGAALLAQALPRVGLVRASADEATNLHAILNRVLDEVTGNRIGSAFAVQQQGQLLLLEVLRAYLAQADDLPPGWLRLLTDERLRPAVTSMHDEPGKPWRLEELARAAAMSRTSFAERFRAVAGVPPLTYLNAWRMQLARHALRDSDTRVGPLAFRLGYTSESAFSNAFKREVGMSPLRYRASVQAV